jgi:hypothetical protein
MPFFFPFQKHPSNSTTTARTLARFPRHPDPTDGEQRHIDIPRHPSAPPVAVQRPSRLPAAPESAHTARRAASSWRRLLQPDTRESLLLPLPSAPSVDSFSFATPRPRGTRSGDHAQSVGGVIGSDLFAVYSTLITRIGSISSAARRLMAVGILSGREAIKDPCRAAVYVVSVLIFLKITAHLYSCFGLIVSVVDRILVMRTLLYSNLNRKSSSIHTHKVLMFVNRKKK